MIEDSEKVKKATEMNAKTTPRQRQRRCSNVTMVLERPSIVSSCRPYKTFTLITHSSGSTQLVFPTMRGFRWWEGVMERAMQAIRRLRAETDLFGMQGVLEAVLRNVCKIGTESMASRVRVWGVRNGAKDGYRGFKLLVLDVAWAHSFPRSSKRRGIHIF